MVHRLLFGLAGQTLSYTPARRQAVSWLLENLTVGDQEASRELGSGTLPGASASTPSAAESGPSTLHVNRVFVPVSADLGEVLRITSADTGVSELFSVAGRVAGQHLTTAVPLTTRYPAGSSVERLRVTTAEIDIEVVSNRVRMQERQPMRVVWTHADGSRHQEQVYLVRHSHGDLDLPGVLTTIHALWPDITTRMEHHGKGVLEDIVTTLAEQLHSELRKRKIPAHDFLTGDAGRFTLAYKVLRHLAAMGNRPGNQEGEEWDEYIGREYNNGFAGLISGGDGEETQQPESSSDTVSPDKPVRSHFGSL